MRKVFAIIAAGLIWAASAYGQQTAFPESLVNRDPRAAAMGGAGSADCTSMAFASMNNLATLPFSSKKGEVAASYSLNSEDALWNGGINFGAGFKAGKRLAFGLGGTLWNGSSYDIIDDTGCTTGSFTAKNMLFNGGFGVKITEKFGLGVGIDYTSESIAPESTFSAIGAKAAVYANLGSFALTLGMNMKGKVTDMHGTDFKMPSYIFAGACYKAKLGEKNVITACLDANYHLSSSISAALGLEYAWNDMVFVRGGYNYASLESPLPSCFTAGLGLKFFGVMLNAAYTLAGGEIPAGNTLTAGIGYCF